MNIKKFDICPTLFQKPKTQGHNKIKKPTLVQTLDPLG
jgi:hypothetical protein